MDLFQNTSVKEHIDMAVEKALRVTINFYKNSVLQLSHKKKKHSLKQVIPITYTLEKKLFVAAAFEGL